MSARKFICTLICSFFLFMGAGTLNAQNGLITIGGGSGQLRITLNTTGGFNVERESSPGSGVWQKQIFYADTPLFALSIDGQVYCTNEAVPSFIGGDIALSPGNDNVSVVGSRGEYSKTFTGSHNGEPFSVVITVIYDTSNPDFFVFVSKIDSRNITGNPVIHFAYGYDAYVNNSDSGVAWILPDPSGYNGVSAIRNLSQAEIRSLQLVGSTNTTSYGSSFMGFFPMGRVFDRAYSYAYSYAYPARLISETVSARINQFNFAPPTSSGIDNGVGVVFENLPSGELTTIYAGLTFTTALDGTLNYLWDGVKNKTLAVGQTANLELEYYCYSMTPLGNVGFKVNFPGLNIFGSTCNMTGFTSGTGTCADGNSYYQLTNGVINNGVTGLIRVPIKVIQYGQWVVNAASISNTTQTLPTGTPATLTASTGVNISSVSTNNVCAGSSFTVTVKLDNTATTSQPITVGLDYTGSTATSADYVSLPSEVIIPVDANSATFTITTTNAAVNGHTFNIRLTETDKAFATIGATATTTVTVKEKPTLSSSLTPADVCSGSPFSYTATCALTGTTTYTWTRAAVTGITPATNSGSGAAINETLTNSTNATIPVVYAITLTNNGCSNTQNVTVNVKPKPTLSSTLTPSAICNGSTFSYTATGTLSGTTFSWSRAAVAGITPATGSGSSGAISETLTNANTTATSVTYAILLTNNGCTNNQNVVVSVSPSPVPTFTGGSATPCGSSRETYTTESGMTGYVWTVTGGTIYSGQGTNSLTVDWNATGAGSISVAYKPNASCALSAPTSQTISIQSLPVVTITGNTGVCAASTHTYSAPAGMTTYTWAITGGTINSGQGSNSISVTWGSGPGGNLSLTYGNACSAAAPATLPVTINALPVPAISGLNSVCAGSQQTYTTATGMSAYVWEVSGGTAVTGQGTNSFTVRWGTTGSGSVSVRYTNTNGCTAASPTVQNVTINSQPTVSIGNATANEGSNLSFTVTLSGHCSTDAATVQYATYDGTAESPDDYTSTSGTLTFLYGETSKTVTVPTVTDNVLEGAETLVLRLSNPTSCALSGGGATLDGTGTINDQTNGEVIVEKYRPTPGITPASEPSTNGSFRIRFANTAITSATNVKVGIAVAASSTAVSNVDYTPISVTFVTIPAGQNGVELPVTVKNNQIVQGTRTLNLTITSIIP